MPSPAAAAKMIKKVCERPNVRLTDSSIDSMVGYGSMGDGIWLTGSSVWLPACFGEMPERDADIDLVFENDVALKVFAGRVLQTLNCKMMGVMYMKELPAGVKGFTIVENKLGGARILHPDGKGVIDMWHLGENQSIAELVSDYPGETYIRCAWDLTARHSTGALLRLAKEDVSPLKGILGAPLQQMSGYPGRGKTTPMKKGLMESLLMQAPPQYPAKTGPDKPYDLSKLKL